MHDPNKNKNTGENAQEEFRDVASRGTTTQKARPSTKQASKHYEDDEKKIVLHTNNLRTSLRAARNTAAGSLTSANHSLLFTVIFSNPILYELALPQPIQSEHRNSLFSFIIILRMGLSLSNMVPGNTYPAPAVMGSESIMNKKAHGTSAV